MRAKITLNFIGKVLIGMAVLFTFPIFTALIYHENILNFVIPQVISLTIGILLNLIKWNITT